MNRHSSIWLCGDGCGDYYFVEAGDRRGRVALLSHDPPGVEPLNVDLAKFLLTAEQDHSIDIEPPPGDVYLYRSKLPGESILDPVGMVEWQKVVRENPALEHLGYRKGINPFSREEMRFDTPGLSVARVAGRGFYIGPQFGRIVAERVFVESKPLVEQIAGALGCHVMFGPPEDDDD